MNGNYLNIKHKKCKFLYDQAILTVLGRRDTTHRIEKQYGLNLSKAQLQGAKLWAAKFQRANFTEAQLQQAVLKNAQLNPTASFNSFLNVLVLEGAATA